MSQGFVQPNLAQIAAVAWSKVSKGGSSLADLETRLASDLQGLLPWASLNKSGSSLADLSTRSAGDLTSGLLALARGGLGADLSAIVKGDLIVGTGAGGVGLKAIGSDGQTLVADAASSGGAKWDTVFEPVTTFATVWTGNISNPAIGNGTMVMKFVRLFGTVVFFSLRMTMGSTTTFGSGNWNHSLPTSFTTTVFGTGAATDASTGLTYPVVVVGGAAADKAQGLVVASSLRCNSTVPFTWTTSDALALDGVMI